MSRPMRARWAMLLACGVVFLLARAEPAQARPSYGYRCVGCHVNPPNPTGDANPRMTLLGVDATADPVEGPGATDLGTRSVYDVAPGATRTLSFSLGDIGQGTRYGVNFTNALFPNGIQSGSPLSFTADPTWTRQENTVPPNPGVWYTQVTSNDPFVPFIYPGAGVPITYSFNITPTATTVPDYYPVYFAWAGAAGRDSGRTQFYLHVVPEPTALAFAGFGALPLLRRRRTFRGGTR